MSFIQHKVHKKAVTRTVEELKKEGIKVTKLDVLSVLKVIHLYIAYLARNIVKKDSSKEGSVYKVKFGYFRVIYPRLFTDMYKAGEFTDEEFKIITEEFYPKEFYKYNDIIKSIATWKKQKLSQKQ